MTNTENTPQNTNETERIAATRESFSARLLNDAQFDEAIAITRIIEREIHKSGTFKDKLGDYANAYARTQRFEAQKAEGIIRDLYKGRTGQTMNQTREALMKREEGLSPDQLALGYEHAVRVGERVERGDKIAFSRAYASEAQDLAATLGITDGTARRIMAEEFEAAENMKLVDWGKELDQTHFQPQIEAEKAERERARSQGYTSRSDRQTGQTQNGQARAEAAWDHARRVGTLGDDNQTHSRTVPRAGARTYSGPTRSGP